MSEKSMIRPEDIEKARKITAEADLILSIKEEKVTHKKPFRVIRNERKSS